MTEIFNDSENVFLKVGKEVPEQDVNIAFYKTPEITPEDNIKIINESLSMSANLNITSDKICYVDHGYKLFYNINLDSSEFNYTFYSKNFVLTDKKYEGTAVFYKHQLRYVHLDTGLDEVYKNVKLIDDKRRELGDDYFYYLDVKELSGMTNNKKRFEITIYLNFEQEKDEQFKILYMPENKSLGNYEEILNPEAIYKRVSSTDFFENRLDSNDKVYAIEKKTDGFAILVPIKAVMQILNGEDELRNQSYLSENEFLYDTKEFYLSFSDSTSKIFAAVNPMLKENDAWPLDINYDSFVDNSMERSYIYDIPEFYYQNISWLEGYPCMQHLNEVAEIEDKYTILLKYKPLHIEEEESEDGIVVPKNITVKDSAGELYKIKNWDVNNGRIYTEKDISNKIITVDYITKQKFFEYNGYYDENGQFISLDLNPRTGHFYSDKKISGTAEVKHHTPSYKLTSKMISVYLKPEYVIDAKDEIITRTGETIFHTINHDLHTNPYHPMINDDIENKYYSSENIKLIARVFIIPITNPEKLEIIDTRTRGGGVKDGLVNELKKIHNDVNFYWDIGKWNGEFYPSNGVVVIELPESVLEDFSHNEIIARIEKQLALGVLPVVEYV